jgi:hypothetical protein
VTIRIMSGHRQLRAGGADRARRSSRRQVGASAASQVIGPARPPTSGSSEILDRGNRPRSRPAARVSRLTATDQMAAPRTPAASPPPWYGVLIRRTSRGPLAPDSRAHEREVAQEQERAPARVARTRRGADRATNLDPLRLHRGMAKLRRGSAQAGATGWFARITSSGSTRALIWRRRR